MKTYTDEQTAEYVGQLRRHFGRLAAEQKSRRRKAVRHLVRRSRRANRAQP